MSDLIRRVQRKNASELLPELEPGNIPIPAAPAPPAPPASTTLPAPSTDAPGLGVAVGQLNGALATGQATLPPPPPPSPSLDPFAPVTLGNDAIQPVPVTYDGQTPAQVVREAVAPGVQQDLRQRENQQRFAESEIANPLPEFETTYNPPDWNTAVNSGIYLPTFRNQAQIEADSNLSSLNDALGGLLSTVQQQAPDSSVGGAFGWVTNAFSKDGSRNYVRSVYMGEDGTYKGNFLGGALYGLGLLWNAPVGAIIDAKNVGANIYEKFAPNWVKNSAGATYRWASNRAPVIGALLEPWTKRDPLNDGKSNFIEALRGASYSFTDPAGSGIGIKREETLGNVPGTNVPFNPSAVLGLGLDVIAGGKLDRALERVLSSSQRGARAATTVLANADEAITPPSVVTGGGTYKQLEIPFVNPVPTNPVPRKPVRDIGMRGAAAARRASMQQAARAQLTLDLGDAVKRTIEQDPWTIPSPTVRPGGNRTVLRRNGKFIGTEEVLVGVQRPDITITKPNLELPPGVRGGDIQLNQGGKLVFENPIDGTPVIFRRAQDVVYDVDWTEIRNIEGTPVRLSLPEAAPDIPTIYKADPSGQLTLPIDVPTNAVELDNVIIASLSTPVDEGISDVATQLSFHMDDFGNTLVSPFKSPDAVLSDLDLVADFDNAVSPSSTAHSIFSNLTGGIPDLIDGFGSVEVGLFMGDDAIVEVGFNVNSAGIRSQRTGPVPFSDLKEFSKFMADFTNKYPDLRLQALISAGDDAEFKMKLRAYGRAGFKPVDELGARIPDANVKRGVLLEYDRSSSLLSARFDTAAKQLARLDATRTLPLTRADDARYLMESARLAKTQGAKILDKIENRLVQLGFTGRANLVDESVRPSTVQVRPIAADSNLTAGKTLYHGTRSKADLLNVDLIRGGAGTADVRGLSTTTRPDVANSHALRPANIDLPESTLQSLGDPRIVEFRVTEDLNSIVASREYAEVLDLAVAVLDDFPELKDVNFMGASLNDISAAVAKEASPEVFREYQVHLSEALRRAGIDAVENDFGQTILNTSKLEVVRTVPKPSMINVSDLARMDSLSRAPDSIQDLTNALDEVDALQSLHRFVNQELLEMEDSVALIAKYLDDSIDETKLWDYNGTPSDVPSTPIAPPTPPPSLKRKPWQFSDDIGPCTL